MNTDQALSRIEAILAEIEQADRESGGQFRQAGDLEAGQIVARIERQIASRRSDDEALREREIMNPEVTDAQ